MDKEAIIKRFFEGDISFVSYDKEKHDYRIVYDLIKKINKDLISEILDFDMDSIIETAATIGKTTDESLIDNCCEVLSNIVMYELCDKLELHVMYLDDIYFKWHLKEKPAK